MSWPRRFCAAVMLAAALAAPPAAQALDSAFIGGDTANAAQVASILAGTPYDMASAPWRVNSNINRGTFAYKVMSGLLMLGYQTEIGGSGDDQHLRALHAFQARNALPVTNLVDAATLTALDAQLALREQVLATLAASFALRDHMQPLHANDVSTDTVAAIYGLAMSALPASLQLALFELVQCVSGQCLGGIQDPAGLDLAAWFYEGTFIDPAAADYRFVGAYFDRARANGRMPSAVVDADTVLHEFAHYLDGSYGMPFGTFPGNPQVPHWNALDTTGFYDIHYDLSTLTAGGCVTPRSTDVTDWMSLYGYTAYGSCPTGQRIPAEDFAEAFTFYVMAGRDFRAAAAQRPMLAQQYAWLKAHVFGGLEYDTHLPQGTNSGCNDVPGTSGRQPAWVSCDDTFVWDFTIPHGVVSGSCGAADGAATWTTPSTNLCVGGAPSVVTGVGPWAWTCSGLNGGASVSCAAPVDRTPSAPTSVAATAANGSATVTFTTPAHDGGSAITSYLVTASPGSVTATGSASPILVNGLTNGTTYAFTVAGVNATGSGHTSASSNAVTPTGPPAAPAIGTATAGNRQASVSFSPPSSNGGAAITAYTVTSSPGGITASGLVSPITITGLTAGTSYTFVVAATNALGTGAASAASNAVVPPMLLLDHEGADAVTAPALPAGWQSLVQIQTNGLWRTSAGGLTPVVSPKSSSNLFVFNAHTAGINQSARLISPAFSLVGVSGGRVGFWVYRDGDASVILTGDSVDAYVNTTTSLVGATKLATINRSRWLSPAVSAAGWYHYVYDLPPTFTGATNYLILVGYSAGSGNDIYVDDVVVATVPAAPTIAAASANHASASVSFSPGDNGGAAVIGFTVTCVPSGGGGPRSATGSTSPVQVTGLVDDVQYSCTVVATNEVGTSAPSGAASVTPRNDDARLATLGVSSGALLPAFSSAVRAYTVTVANDVSSITVTPTTTDAGATVTVDGIPLVTGSSSPPAGVTVGTATRRTVIVTAADGVTQATYTVTVTRSSSSDAALDAIAVSSGTLSPAFTEGTFDYDLVVPHAVATLSVAATPSDATASLTVNGVVVEAASASAPIVLPVGASQVVVQVIAQDATTTRRYTLHVVRDVPPPTPPPLRYSLTVTRSGTGEGTVTGLAGAIDCGTSCGLTLDDGTLVTLAATPSAGSVFAGWEGACTGQGPCSVTMHRCTTVTAVFEKILYRRYLAEGATSSFLDTRLALLNYGPVSTVATLTFSRVVGGEIPIDVPVAAHARVTIDPKSLPGLEAAEFSTVVVSDEPLAVDRTMSWDATGYGAHADTAVTSPSPVWYLAEGATHSGFDLFYLLQNPAAHATSVRVRYLLPSGAPLEKVYDLPARSRTNIWVNTEDIPGQGLALASTDVSAVIETLDATPIIVERALYLSNQGRAFNAGHESAGVTAPSREWFLAEGMTGPYFDLFVLVANPNDVPADVRVTYLLTDGRTFSRTLTAPAFSRVNIWVDDETFDGGATRPLADVAVSTTVSSLNDVPVIVERALWWPGTFATWHEAHNAAGATRAGTEWALAEGAVGGARGEETYILIANTSPFAGSAVVTLYFEDGTSASRSYPLPANSRSNVAVAQDFGEVVSHRRFGAVVTSVGAPAAQIVVERAMYWNAGGVSWAAGTNALGTLIR